ncbi:hypothetical protein BD410DRAFT_792617 [Rickenella mellea]|uniref:Uncharacterized protein n=1 Tax=Rickenella mellea TaxID=50990 RepID=A0A4Y7PUB2_9AGAM|nr:hypothetical protein BD410DRAFT_792617 [Rickenella mellea]
MPTLVPRVFRREVRKKPPDKDNPPMDHEREELAGPLLDAAVLSLTVSARVFPQLQGAVVALIRIRDCLKKVKGNRRAKDALSTKVHQMLAHAETLLKGLEVRADLHQCLTTYARGLDMVLADLNKIPQQRFWRMIREDDEIFLGDISVRLDDLWRSLQVDLYVQQAVAQVVSQNEIECQREEIQLLLKKAQRIQLLTTIIFL